MIHHDHFHTVTLTKQLFHRTDKINLNGQCSGLSKAGCPCAEALFLQAACKLPNATSRLILTLQVLSKMVNAKCEHLMTKVITNICST